jgi:hypothetical protein
VAIDRSVDRLSPTVALTIVAQDPSVRAKDGRILRAIVTVPRDVLQPGPRGPRFHVVDFDPATNVLVPPASIQPREGLDEFALAPDR